jgi:type III pantothenate kinase
MLLAIDVGNTESLVGRYALTPAEGEQRTSPDGAVFGIGAEDQPSGGLTYHWRLSTVLDRTPDEHAVLLTQLLDLEGLDIATTVTGIAVCSSVPAVTGELRRMASRWFENVPCVVLGPGVRSGMPILYDNPKDVGADRVANAVGAYDLYGGPCVVVDLGTATTFDAISASGEYMGGAITPGVAVSLEALFQHAAALRRVELVAPRDVIGRSTIESIQSGVLFGFAEQVDGMCRRILDELGPSTVVATGGLCQVIAPHAKAVQHVEPWLTLHGLRIVFERNRRDAGEADADGGDMKDAAGG